jgi:hypothetical protein
MTGAAAAADTPSFSSSRFTSWAASSSDNPTICSSNCCKSAISVLQLSDELVMRAFAQLRYRGQVSSALNAHHRARQRSDLNLRSP